MITRSPGHNFYGKEALPWLERVGVSEETIADALADEARRVAERSQS